MVEGDPVPKSRARFSPRSKTFYTPERTRVYEETIAWKLREVYKGEPNEDWYYGVRAMFRCKGRQRRDVDNLLKTVLDACNTILWADDNQVLEVFGRRSDCEDSPGAEILIYRIEQKAFGSINCQACGKEVRNTYPSIPRLFCSRECSFASSRVTLACSGCGANFKRARSHGANGATAFCSRACYRRSHNASVSCSICGKTKETYYSYAKAAKRWVCSLECYDKSLTQYVHRMTASYPCTTCSGKVTRKEYKQCGRCKFIAARSQV